MPPALQNPFLLWFALSVALAVLCYFGVRKELRLRATLYGAFILACGTAIPAGSISASTSRAGSTSSCRS